MLKSNGLRHLKNLPVKFGFSPKIVPATIAKKLPPQCCSKPLFIAFFNFSHKRPTFAFTGESVYTLGFRRRIAHSGSHGETGGLPLCRHSMALCCQRNCHRKNSRRKWMHALRRVSAFSGAAAPLGCVILSLVFQHCVLLLSMWNSHTTQTDWYHHSRLVLYAVEPPTSGHRNGLLIVYCSVWQILY